MIESLLPQAIDQSCTLNKIVQDSDILNQILSQQSHLKVLKEQNNTQQQNLVFYQSKMRNIRINYQNLIRDLQISGFLRQRIISKSFPFLIKRSLKTDWESYSYQCRLKVFKTKLNVLKLNLKTQSLVNSFETLGKGQFGRVYKLATKLGQYAVKSIRVQQNNQKQIDKALTEIIITKIASILKAGPKFQTVFGYDAIIFTDSVIFTMQLCSEIEIQNQKDIQKLNQNLLSALKTLHSFKICHIDIKTDNIAWSNKFQRFVLIDFGFAKVLDQAPGQKTKAEYMGTFRYSSPQMKKLYFLKIADFVDLYYNDIHGVKVIISGFTQILKSSILQREIIQYQQYMERPQSQQIFVYYQEGKIPSRKNTEDIIQYFSFRFSLFEQKFDEVEEIICQMRGPIETFKKLIFEELKKKEGDQALSHQLRRLKNTIKNQNDNQTTISSLDFFFLDYTFRISNGMLSASSFQRLIQMSRALNSQSLLQKIWLNPHWMVEIFNFIDVYNGQQENICQNRGGLICKIHSLAFGTESKKSLTMKMRDILILLFQYFEQEDDLSLRMRIQCYFVMFNDIFEQIRMQKIILAGLKKNKQKCLEYIICNIEYFFGKLILSDKMDFIYQWDNQKNLKNLLEQGSDDDVFQELIKDSIAIIRFCKGRYKLLWRKKVQETNKIVSFAQEYIKKYGTYFGSGMKELIIYLLKSQSDFHREHNIQNLTKLNFESYYLKCSISKFVLYSKIQHSQIGAIRQILKKQVFLKEFRLFTHSFGNQLEQNEQSIVCFDLLLMLKHHCFQLQQNDLFYLATILKKAQFLTFLDEYLSALKVYETQQINIKLLGSIYRVLTSIYQILNSSYSHIYKKEFIRGCKDQRIVQKIKKFQKQIRKNCFRTAEAEQELQLNYYLQINQSLIQMIEEQWEVAVRTLIKLHQKYSQFMPINFMARIYLYNQLSNQLKRQIENVLFEYLTRVINYKRFELIFYCHDFLPAVIGPLYRASGPYITYNIVKQCLIFAQKQNRHDVHIFSFDIFRRFYQMISQAEKISLLQTISLNEKLWDFKQCYVILIFILTIVTQQSVQKMEIQFAERIMKICVFYGQKFSKGIFRNFKNMLHQSCTRLMDVAYVNYANSLFRDKNAIGKQQKRLRMKRENSKEIAGIDAISKILQKISQLLKNLKCGNKNTV